MYLFITLMNLQVGPYVETQRAFADKFIVWSCCCNTAV